MPHCVAWCDTFESSNFQRSTDFGTHSTPQLPPLPQSFGGILVDFGEVVLVFVVLLRLLFLPFLGLLLHGLLVARHHAAGSGRRSSLVLAHAPQVEGDEVPHEPGLQEIECDGNILF